MKQFDVTGMSCAACSARVEKAVKEVPGVTECTVSLLTNSLSVNGSADEGAIRARLHDLFLDLVIDPVDEFAFVQRTPRGRVRAWRLQRQGAELVCER